MAIFGVGASYDSRDVSSKFIDKGLACVGWDEKDAPSLHNLLKHIKTGDIVYIKAHPPSIGLIVKAVGVVTGQEIVHDTELGTGVTVKWTWSGDERFGKLEDKYPVRNLTISHCTKNITTKYKRGLFNYCWVHKITLEIIRQNPTYASRILLITKQMA